MAELSKEVIHDTKSLQGIPDFWLTVMNNNNSVKHLIQDYDKPILQNLNDIIVLKENDDAGSFTLKFKFGKGANE